MPSQNIRLTYYIVLTDPDLVAANQALYPHGVNRAPWNIGPPAGGAAIEFSAPWRGYTESALGTAPYTWTPWSGHGTTDGPYPINVARFTRKTGGFFGIGGTTTTYWWVGQFVLAPQTTPVVTQPPGVSVYIPQRWWCEGFEVPGQLCGSQTPAVAYSRDASRHTDGFGLAIRRATSWDGLVAVSLAALGLGTQTACWSRNYVRWRGAGSASFPYLRWHVNQSALAGVAVGVMPSGQVFLENITSAGVRVALGTYGQLVFNEWTKIDVVPQFNNGASQNAGSHASLSSAEHVEEAGIAAGVVDGISHVYVYLGEGTTGTPTPVLIVGHDTSPAKAWVAVAPGDLHLFTDAPPRSYTHPTHSWQTDTLGGGVLSLWINGVKVAAVAVDPTAGGIGVAGQTIQSIEIGNPLGVTADDTEIDLDDWVVSGLPLDSLGNVNYNGVDFMQGSKVQLLRPTAYGGAHANWTGDFRVLLQNAIGTWGTKQVVTSAVSGAVMEAATDLAQAVGQDTHALGVTSMQVVMQSLRGTTGSGTLGYKIDAAAAVDTAIVQSATMGPNVIMYRPVNGTVLPAAIAAILLRHTKAADTSTGQVATLLAQVELIGMFWTEDIPAELDPKPPLPARVGIHNAPYDRTPWAQDGLTAPIAPVLVIGGTYVGNGTGQDLSFRAPIHFLFVRNAAGAQPGGIWWSSMLAAHRNANLGVEPFYAVQAKEDQSFAPIAGVDTQQQRYLVRIAGSDAQANQNAVTYQYIAVSDPGGRYLLNMATAHRAALASYVAALIDAGFTPEWAFFTFEDLTATATSYLGVKGPGHATESVTRVNGTTTTTALAFGAGALTGKTALWSFVSHLQVAFSLWRRHDGTNDPGEAGIFAIGSYLGDAAASRTLNVGTAGKRPLFAIVQPENANGLVRDPSHTGTTSQVLVSGTSNASTGITGGGLDQINVGSVLNANGVTHHYFILWGGTAAGNGGWSTNSEYIPVEADDDPDDGDTIPPITADDVATTAFNTPVTINVLANDNPGLTITAVSTPAHGVAVITADQKITYTPTTGYSGADTFTYTVTDGTVTGTAGVAVTVSPSGGGGGGGGGGGCSDAWGTLAATDLPYVPLQV